MKKYFAYTRVSTTRQGELGVSLQQQTDAIKQFAARTGLQITQWFEEQETAAKSGRPVFGHMLRRLRRRDATGVIIHKIDRSARNLKDWAELGQLIDQGIEVHVANESLDLTSRGGRLSADIQAVVASDFIRNLREETKKGFYGRLKQGYYPMPAPLGYKDEGGGKTKSIHPVYGGLVREAFHLYATQRYSLNTLTAELEKMGLRSRSGKFVTRNGVHRMLRNSFYIGIIRIAKTRDCFHGLHEPLISKLVFDRVEEILQGKRIRGTTTMVFRYSRLIRCRGCGRSLIGVLKKGHTYYRCQMPACPTSLREESIDEHQTQTIGSLVLNPQELGILDLEVSHRRSATNAIRQREVESIQFHLRAIDDRHNRLMDAYVDGLIAKEDFERRKETLQMERFGFEEKLKNVEAGNSTSLTEMEEYVSLVREATLFTRKLFETEFRDWLNRATCHRQAFDKTVDFTMRKPLAEVSLRPGGSNGSPCEDNPATFWQRWLDSLLEIAVKDGPGGG